MIGIIAVLTRPSALPAPPRRLARPPVWRAASSCTGVGAARARDANMARKMILANITLVDEVMTNTEIGGKADFKVGVKSCVYFARRVRRRDGLEWFSRSFYSCYSSHLYLHLVRPFHHLRIAVHLVHGGSATVPGFQACQTECPGWPPDIQMKKSGWVTVSATDDRSHHVVAT